MIEMIVAHDLNHVIGKDNGLVWHISEDLKYFKKMTTGKKVVMGRKTYESIGRLLPNRENIIVTRDINYSLPGATIYNSIDEVIEKEPNFIVIGGSNIYEQFLGIANTIYATIVQHEFDGDAYFPKYEHLYKLETTNKLTTEKDNYELHFNKYTLI